MQRSTSASEQTMVPELCRFEAGAYPAPCCSRQRLVAFSQDLDHPLQAAARDGAKIERRTSNRLLQLLPSDYLAWLLPRMEEVSLPVPTLLYQPSTPPRFAHFMTSGMVSIVTFMKDGHGVEVGLVGSESLVEGLHLLGHAEMPTTGFLQVEGAALRLPFSDLAREFAEHNFLRSLVLQAVQVQAVIVQQLAACNRLHEVEERMSRWLLSVSDRVGNDEFAITQEFLAQMIGTQRTTVTLTAGNLQRSGLIEYRRGRMTLLDRERLESAACECYSVVRGLMSNMYR